VAAKTFEDAQNCIADAIAFMDSPAESQVVNGYQFFKVLDDQNLEYILLAKGTSDDVYMLGKLAAFSFRTFEFLYENDIFLIDRRDKVTHFSRKQCTHCFQRTRILFMFDELDKTAEVIIDMLNTEAMSAAHIAYGTIVNDIR